MKFAFSVLACVLSGYSGFLPHSKDIRVRFIEDNKLPIGGVNVSEFGSLSLCIYWQKGEPAIAPFIKIFDLLRNAAMVSPFTEASRLCGIAVHAIHVTAYNGDLM